MYYMARNTHGAIKIDWATAWSVIRDIINSGLADGSHHNRSFKLSF